MEGLELIDMNGLGVLPEEFCSLQFTGPINFVTVHGPDQFGCQQRETPLLL